MVKSIDPNISSIQFVGDWKRTKQSLETRTTFNGKEYMLCVKLDGKQLTHDQEKIQIDELIEKIKLLKPLLEQMIMQTEAEAKTREYETVDLSKSSLNGESKNLGESVRVLNDLGIKTIHVEFKSEFGAKRKRDEAELLTRRMRIDKVEVEEMQARKSANLKKSQIRKKRVDNLEK